MENVRFKTILDDFRSYMEDVLDDQNISTNSITSYISYVKRAFELVFGIDELDLLDSHSVSVEQRGNLEAKLERILQNQIQNTDNTSSVSRKTLSNYLSGVRLFWDFLGYRHSGKEVIDESQKIESSFEEKKLVTRIDLKYTKQQIYKVFKARLKTQDRFYEHIALPFRLLNKVFNTMGYQKQNTEVLDNEIWNVKFLIKNDSKTLKEITGLEISGCEDYLAHSGHQRLLTKCADGSVVPMTAKTLSTISLDHDTPLFQVVENNEGYKKYPALVELSEEIARFFDVNTILELNNYEIKKRISTSFFEARQDYLSANVDRIFSEYKKLHESINLTAMDKIENIRRNAG